MKLNTFLKSTLAAALCIGLGSFTYNALAQSITGGGGGGSGTVNSGVAPGVAYYATNGTTVSDGGAAVVNAGGLNVTGSTLPTYGVYLSAGNNLGFSAASTLRGFISGTGLTSNTNNGPSFRWAAASSTVPTLVPNANSTTTGWGADQAGSISGIIVGAEVLRIRSPATNNSGFAVLSSLFTGGTGTSTVPLQYFNTGIPSAVTDWSTSGTYLGVNANSGFAGNFLDFHVNGGASVFAVSSGGNVNAASNFTGLNYTAATTGFFRFGGSRSRVSSSADGQVEIFASDGTTPAQLNASTAKLNNLSASSAVCTDGSKVLTTSGCSAGGISQTTGTWTPTLTGSGTAGSQTYLVQYGNYVKTGVNVVATFEVRLKSFTATGNVLLTDLPFSSANTNGGNATAGVCSIGFYQGFTFAASNTQISAQIRPNGTTADVYTGGSGAGAASQDFASLTSNAYLTGTCSYQSAS